ncbi:hypothetical protein ACM66B_007026 [Microbotryomycetes sp. NB124-2]
MSVRAASHGKRKRHDYARVARDEDDAFEQQRIVYRRKDHSAIIYVVGGAVLLMVMVVVALWLVRSNDQKAEFDTSRPAGGRDQAAVTTTSAEVQAVASTASNTIEAVETTGTELTGALKTSEIVETTSAGAAAATTTFQSEIQPTKQIDSGKSQSKGDVQDKKHVGNDEEGQPKGKDKDKDKNKVDGETFTGKATFYYQGGAAGACEHKHADSAMICALAPELYASGQNCARKLEITRSGSQKKVTVEVADLCPSCEEKGSVDLSEAAFLVLGEKDEGTFSIEWHFVS